MPRPQLDYPSGGDDAGKTWVVRYLDGDPDRPRMRLETPSGGGGGGDMLAANNLSDVDDPAVARGNLGVEIGADVQGYDADLDYVAANLTTYGRNVLAGAAQTFSNVNVTVNAATRVLIQTGTMTASRTATLPLANSVAAGTTVLVIDFSGSATSTNTIAFAATAPDSITSTPIAYAYGTMVFVSDGTSKWSIDGSILRANHLGSIVQQYDADLAALAGLTSAADKLPYFTGSGTAAVADFTSAGRALVDDADASAQRTTLGLGTASTAASGDFFPTAQTVNAQTGTTYTPVAGDVNKLVTLSNASAITLTLPQDSDVTVAVGAHIDFAQIGAGQVTVAAGTGATVNATPGLKFRSQYSVVSAVKRAANTWLLAGDLSA